MLIMNHFPRSKHVYSVPNSNNVTWQRIKQLHAFANIIKITDFSQQIRYEHMMLHSAGLCIYIVTRFRQNHL